MINRNALEILQSDEIMRRGELLESSGICGYKRKDIEKFLKELSDNNRFYRFLVINNAEETQGILKDYFNRLTGECNRCIVLIEKHKVEDNWSIFMLKKHTTDVMFFYWKSTKEKFDPDSISSKISCNHPLYTNEHDIGAHAIYYINSNAGSMAGSPKEAISKYMKILTLWKIEEEYSLLLREMMYTETPQGKEFLAELFRDLGDLYQIMSKYFPKIQFCTDSCIFYQYSVNLSSKNIYGKLGQVRKRILLMSGQKYREVGLDIEIEILENKGILLDLRKSSSDLATTVEKYYKEKPQGNFVRSTLYNRGNLHKNGGNVVRIHSIYNAEPSV